MTTLCVCNQHEVTSLRTVVNRFREYLGKVTDSKLSSRTFLSLIPLPLSQVDRLEDELASEQDKLKGITEELEQTFAEMSGY